MFLSPEYSQNNFLPFLGFLGGMQSPNPFVNMFNNIAQMQMMQGLYAQQPQSNHQETAYAPPVQQNSTSSLLPEFLTKPINAVTDYTKNLFVEPTQTVNTGVDNIVNRIANAIGMVESSNNYKALGPQTKSGDRAYGKYQVMGNNVPVWTKEVLGQSLTPQQFLANQQAQDKVALAKMGQYYNKYQTPHDVASMWFSGRPAQNNWRRDVTGTSVPTYMKRVLSYMR